MSKVQSIKARQILDSRGVPTIETMVILDDGNTAKSSVGAGLLKGTYEAVTLRDDDKNKYNGLGVNNAIKAVNEVIGPKIVGMDPSGQQNIDKLMMELDGTQNKSNLGANSMLSVSQAIAKATAKSYGLPLHSYLRQFVSGGTDIHLPVPMFNFVEGSRQGRNLLNFREFLIIPASSKTFSESLNMCLTIYQLLKQNLLDKGQGALVANEGGFSPSLSTNQEGFNLLMEAIEASSFSFSLDVFMGVDCGASGFLDDKNYKLSDRATPYSISDLTDYYKSLISDYSLIYIEDPFGENDWDGWKKMAETLGQKILVTGDDLIATNPYRLQEAINNKVIGGVIIKPSQIGTISEAIAVVEIARYTGLKIVVSSRSAETEDDFMADFAVGVSSDYIKFGAPVRERNVKYNRLTEIEEEVGNIKAAA